jgi:protocatechuate 3,4-dioxygenase beta subunit
VLDTSADGSRDGGSTDGGNPPVEDLHPDSADALAPGESALGVTLYDHESRPVSDALVRLLHQSRSSALWTDSKGGAEFLDVADASYVLRVETDSRPVLVTARRLVLHRNERLAVTYVLPPFDLQIAGRVVDEKGTAVPDVRILARRVIVDAVETDLLPLDESEQSTETSADGSFEIAWLESGEYDLQTSGSENHAPSNHLVPAGTLNVELVLQAGRAVRIHGTVTDSEGKPLSGAEVASPGRHHVLHYANQRGEYSLRRIVRPDKRVLLVARAPAHRVARHAIEPDKQPEGLEWKVDLQLEREDGKAWVAGSVHTDSGEPLPAMRIEIWSPKTDTRRTGLSRVDGRFEIRDLPPGDDYDVRIRPRRRFADWRRRPVTISESGTELDITLEILPTAHLNATVVDAAGEPVSDWAFRLRGADATTRAKTGRTSKSGTFALEDVPAGEVILESRSPPLVIVRGTKLEPDIVQSVTFVIDLGPYEVTGSVLDTSGVPVVGCDVELTWSHKEDDSRSSCLRTASTDDEGRFHFRDVGPGKHALRAAAGKTESEKLSVNPAKSSSPVQLRLSASE